MPVSRVDLHCSVAHDNRAVANLAREVLEQWNRDVWRVPVFVAPFPRGTAKENVVIEVDPDYMEDEDYSKED